MHLDEGELINELESAWESAIEDNEGARTRSTDVLNKLPAEGYERVRGLAIRNLAYTGLSSTDSAYALHLVREAWRILGEHGTDLDLATAAYIASEFYQNLGNFDEALRSAQSALAAAKRADDARWIAWTAETMGRVSLAVGERPEAVRYLEDAFTRFREIDHSPGIFRSAEALVDLLLDDNRIEEADAIASAIPTPEDPRGVYSTWTLGPQAKIAAARGEDDRALELYRQALEAVVDAGNPPFLNDIRISYAEQLTKSGHYREAIETLEEVEAIARSAERTPDLLEMCALRSDTYECMGNYLEALKWAREYQRYREILFSEEQSRRIRQVEMEAEVARIEADAELRRLRDVAEREKKLRSLFEQNQDLNEELQELNRNLEAKVEQRTADLQHQKELLAAVSDERRTLLQVLSHDLKNPLSAILSVIEFLSARPEKSSEYLGRVKESASSAIELIDTVRQMLAVESGKVSENLIPVRLSDSVRRAASMLQHQFRDKGVSIEVDVDPEILVIAEPVSLSSSVIANLLSNALKFSEEGGSVRLRSRPNGDQYELLIEDEGIGIPDELQGRIFDANAKTRRRGTGGELGTGFGMPLVKRIVESYGGRVGITSPTRDDGRGTTIRISLPATALQPSA